MPPGSETIAEYKLFRKFSIIAALTALSRLLGVLRDSVCAAVFGGGVVWDAFSFAFRVPNLFRKLLGEGALSAAFIPTFTEYLTTRGKRDAWRLAGAVALLLALVLLALLALAEACVLLLPHLCTLGERWRLTLTLTALLLPYMVFICATALAGAVLNSLKHFAAPAVSPVVLNLCWLIAVLVFAPLLSATATGRIFVVAFAILVAGVFQLALQLVALHRKGFRWELTLDPAHPGVRKIARSMAPIILGLAAFQINTLVDGVIAISLSAPEGVESFTALGARLAYPMQVGANSVLYYANRLMQFPLGVFGIALATASFPLLSEHAARQDWRRFSDSLVEGVGAVTFIAIPSAVGLILLAEPAVGLLFQRGAFTASMAQRTNWALLAYSAGLWAYCAQHVLSRAFYSTGDTVTPVKVALATVLLNLALNLTLIWFMAEAGLAAATACSATCQVLILYVLLARKGQLSGQARLMETLAKTALAALVMGIVCRGVLRLLPPAPSTDDIALKLARLLLPAAAGTVAFLACAFLLGIRELRTMLRQIGLGRR